MGFPHRVYGWYGDEKVAQSTKISGLPLGIRMELPDGREFVHAKAGTAAAITAGVICQAPVIAGTASAETALTNGVLTVVAATVGATAVAISAGATTAWVKNEFADGYLVVASSVGTGIGHVYKIKSNNSAAVSVTATFNLYENDAVKVAIDTTAKVGVRTNEFYQVIIMTSDTVYTGPPAGVTPVAVSAGFYFWLQRKGVAPVLSGATLLVAGEPVVASTGDVAGAGHNMAGTAVTNQKSKAPIGYSMGSAASAGYATVFLTLP